MDYLVDVYIKKPNLLAELFNKKVNISVKVDGSAFQITNDNGNVEYHKRGGSSSKIGPVIDEYTKLFAGHLNDAIEFFSEGNKGAWKEIQNHKFLAIEMLPSKMDGSNWVLLTAIDNNDRIINPGEELEEIAANMSIFSVPLLFDGNTTGEMENLLVDMMTLSEDTSNEDFVNLLFKIFPDVKKSQTSWEELLRNSEVEGIVLTWELNGKLAQYKIINPAFKKRHEAEQAAAKEKAEKNRDNLNNLIKFLTDKLDKEGEKLDDNHLKSLELNFLKFIVDPKFLNKLINVAAKVAPNENKFFSLQVNKTSKEMQKVLKKHGTPLVTAYEQFLMTFNKERKRSFIISKEFQDKVNALVNKI